MAKSRRTDQENIQKANVLNVKNMFARHKSDTDKNPKQSGIVAIERPTLLRLLLAYILLPLFLTLLSVNCTYFFIKPLVLILNLLYLSFLIYNRFDFL